MGTIKAIETEYKGYRFRSRTEARWAVFFDACGIAYEYEHQGFVLPNGSRYLPDFWLPSVNWFIEIKGEEPTPEEINKCQQLSRFRRCILLSGTPGPDYAGFLFGDPHDDNGPVPIRFAECRDCGELTFVLLNEHPRGWAEDTDFFCEMYAESGAFCKSNCRGDRWAASEPVAQLLAGRQARFEHGECG